MGPMMLWWLLTVVCPLRLLAVVERTRHIRTSHSDSRKPAGEVANDMLQRRAAQQHAVIVDSNGALREQASGLGQRSAEQHAVIVDSNGELRAHALGHLPSSLNALPLHRASLLASPRSTPLTRGSGWAAGSKRRERKRARASHRWQGAQKKALVNHSRAFEDLLERKLDDHALLMVPDHIVGDVVRYLSQESHEGLRQAPTLLPTPATTVAVAAAPVATALTTGAPVMTTAAVAAAPDAGTAAAAPGPAPGVAPGQAAVPPSQADGGSSSSMFFVLCILLFVAVGCIAAAYYFKSKPAAGRLGAFGGQDDPQVQVWKSTRNRSAITKSMLAEKSNGQKSDDSDEDDRPPFAETATAPAKGSAAKSPRGSRAAGRAAASAPSGSENEKPSASGGTGGSAYRDRRMNR